MTTRDIVHIGLFAALTASLALFPPLVLPLVGVPITAQSMGMMLAGTILGAKRGGLAIALFVLLVAGGLPLLAGGRGGLGPILGPGGGFILSWPIGAAAIGFFCRSAGRGVGPVGLMLSILAGTALTYAVGLPWIAATTGIGLRAAVLGSLPFLPGDAAKIVVAALIAHTVRRAYPNVPLAHGGPAGRR